MNDYCQIDYESNFNISELIQTYQDLFSKEKKSNQDNIYGGIGFQGVSPTDSISAPLAGMLINNGELPPRSEFSKLQTNVEQLNQRHSTLCVGEYSRILDYLESKGWYTFRARVMTAMPSSKPNWHTDAYDISLRYHIPIITNEHFFLQWKDRIGVHSVHIPANGRGYFIRTDILHQYINIGTEPRVHIVIDIKK